MDTVHKKKKMTTSKNRKPRIRMITEGGKKVLVRPEEIRYFEDVPSGYWYVYRVYVIGGGYYYITKYQRERLRKLGY